MVASRFPLKAFLGKSADRKEARTTRGRPEAPARPSHWLASWVLPLIFRLSCLSAMGPLAPGALADAIQEPQLQAAFIYQFTNYIEWPRPGGGSVGTVPFVITIVGTSPLTQELDQVSKEKSVNGRRIEVRKIAEGASPQNSDIIVVDTADEAVLTDIINKSKKFKSLVVSAANGFAEKGSMINFFKEGELLRFEINRAALDARGLKASSQLLKMARIVE